ncbi:hypothetical protein ACWCP6_11525 [Streptomyces sp. NPDC002004]
MNAEQRTRLVIDHYFDAVQDSVHAHRSGGPTILHPAHARWREQGRLDPVTALEIRMWVTNRALAATAVAERTEHEAAIDRVAVNDWIDAFVLAQ